MEELIIQKRADRLKSALKYMSAVLVTAGVTLLTVLLFLVNGELLERVSEEIMIPGSAVMSLAVAGLLLVVASGLVSLYRVRYGWLFLFFNASLILLMGLLMWTGTVFATEASFITMIILSLLLWAAAIVYYFWDLYT